MAEMEKFPLSLGEQHLPPTQRTSDLPSYNNKRMKKFPMKNMCQLNNHNKGHSRDRNNNQLPHVLSPKEKRLRFVLLVLFLLKRDRLLVLLHSKDQFLHLKDLNRHQNRVLFTHNLQLSGHRRSNLPKGDLLKDPLDHKHHHNKRNQNTSRKKRFPKRREDHLLPQRYSLLSRLLRRGLPHRKLLQPGRLLLLNKRKNQNTMSQLLFHLQLRGDRL